MNELLLDVQSTLHSRVQWWTALRTTNSSTDFVLSSPKKLNCLSAGGRFVGGTGAVVATFGAIDGGTGAVVATFGAVDGGTGADCVGLGATVGVTVGVFAGAAFLFPPVGSGHPSSLQTLRNIIVAM